MEWWVLEKVTDDPDWEEYLDFEGDEEAARRYAAMHEYRVVGRSGMMAQV